MKENSKKALLALYSTDKKAKLLGNAVNVTAILQDLQPGGQRAMLTWWEKQGWIESFAMPGGRQIALTALGRTSLEKELPFFQLPENWAGEWQLVVLRQAPESDKAFHSLRDTLIKSGALIVSRGVYAFIDHLPLTVEQKIATKYTNYVSIMRVVGHSSNDLNDLALNYFRIYDKISLYSGISRETDTLLTIFNRQKGLIDRHKIQGYSLYDRFFAEFCGDNGLALRLINGSQNPLAILTKLQDILLK